GAAAEYRRRLKSAADAQVGPRPVRTAPDLKPLAGMECERLAGFERLPITFEGEGRSRDHAGEVAVGFQRRTDEVDFERRGVGSVADQGVAHQEGEAVGGAAERNAQTTA